MPPSADTSQLLSGVRILVVDDEPELLEILDAWFTCFGTKIHTASDGFAAVALAKQTPFDLMITDLKMPGLDGLQLMAIVKELDPTVEVIFLTGTGTMDDAIAALREGRAFDFLQKPIKNLTQLNEVILRAVARRQALLEPARKGLQALPEHLEELSPREIDIISLLAQVGSSRVDLQACKLEYSIVSPK